MQVRIDRDEAVEAGGYQPCEGLRGDGFAGPETTILPHIREIGGHQRNRDGSERPCRVRKKDEPEETFVGACQRRNEQNRFPRHVIDEARIGFAIGEVASFDGAQIARTGVGQIPRQGLRCRGRQTAAFEAEPAIEGRRTLLFGNLVLPRRKTTHGRPDRFFRVMRNRPPHNAALQFDSLIEIKFSSGVNARSRRASILSCQPEAPQRRHLKWTTAKFNLDLG